MKKEIIPVEPLSTYLENWKAPTSAVTRCGDTIYVSGFPPFDPETGKGIEAPIERQAELVLEQMNPATASCYGRGETNLLPKVLKASQYQMAHHLGAFAWCATTTCSIDAKRRNIIRR
jgi:enamine deaminase RidA (YjgF/YER057c/UK114 family)